MQVAKEVKSSHSPKYGRSQIWAYIVDLERFVVVPIEPRKGDAAEFFRDPKRIWEKWLA